MNLEILQLRKDKIAQFNKKGIYTVEDLLTFLPRKYYDFTNPKLIKDLKDNEYESVVGTLIEIKGKNENKIIQVKLLDKDNRKMSITFFNQPFLIKTLKENREYIACGLIKYLKDYHNYRTMINPLIFSEDIEGSKKVLPIYSSIPKMSNHFLFDKINASLQLMDKDDYLENVLLYKYNLIPKYKTIIQIHQPKTLKDVELAQKRLLFDDLFKFNFKLKESQKNINRSTNIEIKTFKRAKILMDNLPFNLTDGQRKVLRNISNKMVKRQRVNALVQGDVGCGKTLVAILLMVTVSDNGYQTCLVAPTNILAKQHYEELRERVEPLGFRVGFLSSELKTKERKNILKLLKNGELDMIVGTHSLMSDKVEFKNLGMAIVDEEHKFGVEQRDSLNLQGIHSVTMSATPIPRSLALSMYGDSVDVETITALPKGRKEIITKIIDTGKDDDVYLKILEELKKGRQGYIVCPFVNKSESEMFGDVCNVDDEFKKATAFFSRHHFKVGVITGKMKDNEIEEEINSFKSRKYDVLVATTIIEVGVNVPNATVIAIKSAERFGFAQLHQLRGRVGRGNYNSYCYLVTKNSDKFDIFTKTRDGFEIAKQDLLLRGAGSFLGTQQSGSNKYLMLMLANPKLNESITEDICEIIKDDKRKRRYEFLLDREEFVDE